MIRLLQMARRLALKPRTQTAKQVHALVVSALEPLRSRLRLLSLARLLAAAAAFRPCPRASTPLDTTKLALRCLARRHRQLSAEIELLEQQLTSLVAPTAPELLALMDEYTPLDEPIHLLLDPVSAHCSAEVAAWLGRPSGADLRVPFLTRACVLAVVHRGLVLDPESQVPAPG